MSGKLILWQANKDLHKNENLFCLTNCSIIFARFWKRICRKAILYVKRNRLFISLICCTILYCTFYCWSGYVVRLFDHQITPTPFSHKHIVLNHSKQIITNHHSEDGITLNPMVLVFFERNTENLQTIIDLLIYNRINYNILKITKKNVRIMPEFEQKRYAVIVFENLKNYYSLDRDSRDSIDYYCRQYSVGIIAFVHSNKKSLKAVQFHDLPLTIHNKLKLKNASLNPTSNILRLTKSGNTVYGQLPGNDWTVFKFTHTTYEAIELAQCNTSDIDESRSKVVTVVHDRGHFDDIQRILFGNDLTFWLHRLLFLDSLSYLSHGQFSLNLERKILIDIDDIFVSEPDSSRLIPADVLALIAAQKRIANLVPGFQFNLGFSGGGYHNGTVQENLADDLLLNNVQKFNWFPHIWLHKPPHLYENISHLINDMFLNYKFALDHGIPINSSYAIAPYHSGVYPVHEALYTAWKEIWNIQVTSTEEYPHLRPAHSRRGFKYRNIMVLPRQLCDLFSHTKYIDKYPGGRHILDKSIHGGNLFQTIVYNRINIFMTHMPNYGADRLALYTFESVINFINGWTNLKLSSSIPLQLGEEYFDLYPQENDPLWGNPCDDLRHMKIWSKNKNCNSLPNFLIIGPSNTGTTALYTFLNMHPNITSNRPTANHNEEVQFFNKNYIRGLDTYLSVFPSKNNTIQYIFEKSASYFPDKIVPKRAYALLPQAKIIIILISPAKRAYSWYQYYLHTIPMHYSFHDVITTKNKKELLHMRDSILEPGRYAKHIKNWMKYYPEKQIHIIDGTQLTLNPAPVMDKLQNFLKMKTYYNYSNQLRYDYKKRFYCQIINEERNKCLRIGKGRKYPPMEEKSSNFLIRFYRNDNMELLKLLTNLKYSPIPQWLTDDILLKSIKNSQKDAISSVHISSIQKGSNYKIKGKKTHKYKTNHL